MRALQIETLAIGDELLDGRLADSNSKMLADALSHYGLTLARTTTVADDVDEIAARLKECAKRADVIITSGGLGPTTDDLTAQAVGRAKGEALRFDEAAFSQIKARFAQRNLEMSANNRQQAEVPLSSQILENTQGSAPAFQTELSGSHIISLPGVPFEFRHLVHEHVLPLLFTLDENLQQKAAPQIRTLRCIGIAESALGQKLESLKEDFPQLYIQYRTSFPENFARLSMAEPDATLAEKRLEQATTEAKSRLGNACYAVSEHELPTLVVAELKRIGATLSCAESCTGGGIGAAITQVSGASEVFSGGLISYSNEVKMAQLKVQALTLEQHGAVSCETAHEMAKGAQELFKTDFALSVTGIAGPNGGTAEKPVGTVCFGLSVNGEVQAKKRFIPVGSRERIRQMSVAIALKWLLTEARKRPSFQKA